VRAIVLRRELLRALIQKDFETRYAGSVLGVLWTQLYPLLLLGVYSLVFAVIFKTAIPDFPIFLFTGIVLWNFFNTAVMSATNSVLGSAQLITRIGFPRELVPLAAVLTPLVDVALSHLILIGAALAFGVTPAWTWLALPPLLTLLVLLCIGIGLILSSAAVYLRDVRFFVEVGVLLLMFLSPIFYSEDAVPQSLHWLLVLNPLGVVISAYRHTFLSHVWPSLRIWSVLIALDALVLWVGLNIFARAQKGFPDAL